ncbi:hypothetical protein ACI2L1_41045 [Streptomyces sp. NPDC019531]
MLTDRWVLTDGVDVALFRVAKPVKAPHVKLADGDPRKDAS